METYLARQTRAANVQRSKFLTDEWDDTVKPALEQIEKAALGFLHALDMARSEMMRADDIAALDALACDTAGGTIDVINHLIGTQRRELDDHDGDVEQMRLDLSVIEDEHKTWNARWEARRPK